MNEIESLYQARLREMSGQEKVARTASLFEEVRAMLRRRIESTEPDLTEREIRIKIARALYRTDRGAQRLLSLLER